MKFLVAALFLWVEASSQEFESSSLHVPKIFSALRIISHDVGGTVAKPGQFPYRGFFKSKNHTCAAVLIKERWALTSAHCLEKGYDKTVNFGGISNQLYPVQRKIINGVIHPKYNSSLLLHDIALIHFEAVPLGPLIRPVEFSDLNTVEGRLGTITGYVPVENNPSKGQLKYGHVNIISNDECKEIYLPDYVTNSTVCAKFDPQNGLCFVGDIGGPLVVGYADGALLVGIHKFGTLDSCKKNLALGFERVDHCKEWIDKTTSVDIEG